jgi:anthranilate phosphoribosyltransferase
MDKLSVEIPAEFDPKLLIKALGRGVKGARSLTLAEAKQLILGFATGQVSAVQMASAMMLMRLRGETVPELAGVALGLKALVSDDWQGLKPRLDWPVYAGKRGQLPWLLLAAKALAQQGVTIVLHGDALALPHRCHVARCLESLGIECATNVAMARRALTQQGVVYVPVDVYLPVANQCRQLHQELGLRSLVQLSLRCINPFGARASLRSYFHPGVDIHHRQIAQLMLSHGHAPLNVAIFKGQQGETEVNPRIATTVTVLGMSELSKPRLDPTVMGAVDMGAAAIDSAVLTGTEVWITAHEIPTLLEGALGVNASVATTRPLDGAMLTSFWNSLFVSPSSGEASLESQAYWGVIGTLVLAYLAMGECQNVNEAMVRAKATWANRHSGLAALSAGLSRSSVGVYATYGEA